MTEQEASTAVADATAKVEKTEAVVKTKAQLMQEAKKALERAQETGAPEDFKTLAAVGRELAKVASDEAKTEFDAKAKVLEVVGDKVKATILKALKPLVDSKELDAADGVWFEWDFGNGNLTAIRLMKSQPKAARASGGGGGGKKYDVKTADLLAKYGSDEYKEGQTFTEAQAAATDGNSRYKVRQALLKKAGVTS